MVWDEDLSDEQRRVASYNGTHARLIAGPGTGKTRCLTCRILYLTTQLEVEPQDILALSFTRAAAYELRRRVEEQLSPLNIDVPRISTLHSFALRQLVLNDEIGGSIPSPIRIADDFEERFIIEEDLKRILNLRIKEIRQKFNLLSADWQRLEEEWETNFSDPRFVAAWLEHRNIFRYTLRSELVYQLKRAIERDENFRLERNYSHILVDEYQDLNMCDLEVIKLLVEAGDAELYVAGDDDQSIYGFRCAHPEGIRQFERHYTPFENLTLESCHRCERDILSLGLFIAGLDPRRIPKEIKAITGADRGVVKLLRFANENAEALGIARLCHHLIENDGESPENILILLRADSQRRYSTLIADILFRMEIPVALNTEMATPLDSDDGRRLLAILRLCLDGGDRLALRFLLQSTGGIGNVTLDTVYSYAVENTHDFTSALNALIENEQLALRNRRRLQALLVEINGMVNIYRATIPINTISDNPDELLIPLIDLIDDIINDNDEKQEGLISEYIPEDSGPITIAIYDGINESDPEITYVMVEKTDWGLQALQVWVGTLITVPILALVGHLWSKRRKEKEERENLEKEEKIMASINKREFKLAEEEIKSLPIEAQRHYRYIIYNKKE